MGIQINWNAVTAVCAIGVTLYTASGWLTDGLSEDIRDLRLEMHEGFTAMREEISEIRVDIKELQQDVAYIKDRNLPDQMIDGNVQRPDSGKQRNPS
ncbi:MAG: hypothetical protein F4X08_05410 [Gemmatimonadetes bacterium]|nr:hypothetical protein [Gammaproteobacteria bacterium]MYD25231.1 hypothetical protein [Gemmatimonadota bacterium]